MEGCFDLFDGVEDKMALGFHIQLVAMVHASLLFFLLLLLTMIIMNDS